MITYHTPDFVSETFYLFFHVGCENDIVPQMQEISSTSYTCTILETIEISGAQDGCLAFVPRASTAACFAGVGARRADGAGNTTDVASRRELLQDNLAIGIVCKQHCNLIACVRFVRKSRKPRVFGMKMLPRRDDVS